MTDLNPNQAVGLATKAVRTVDFDQEFAYDGPLGAFYTPQSTRVGRPAAVYQVGVGPVAAQ